MRGEAKSSLTPFFWPERAFQKKALIEIFEKAAKQISSAVRRIARLIVALVDGMSYFWSQLMPMGSKKYIYPKTVFLG